MRHFRKGLTIAALFTFLFFGVLELEALARAGGGRSFGSRGSRPSAPSRSYSSPAPSQPRTDPAPGAGVQQTPGAMAGRPFGGLMGGIGGFLLGGFLGSMLFGGHGIAGPGAMGGGIGFIEILLFGLLAYGLYRFIKSRRQQAAYATNTYYSSGPEVAQTGASYQPAYSTESSQESDAARGLSHIRQMDPSFDEKKFRDGCLDIFFRIQAAWANRDLSSVNTLLTADAKSPLQEGVEELRRAKRINRLENIAIREVEPIEVWQESGNDYITVKLLANLLDYTADESTGQVISGSKTDPVKFEEYWTFTRPVGNNPWKLSAIQQV